ncbi:MAG: flagellar assembly protein FliW [Inquilinaceae bacterium]
MSAADPQKLHVTTRFGVYEVDADKLITLPKGLVGFGDRQRFALLNLPQEGADRFKLLQSVDDPALSFYVIPSSIDGSGVEPQDLEEAASLLDSSMETLALLFIVTIRKDQAGVVLTMNMRAPVVLDPARCVALQHVMTNDKYAIRHPLAG